VIVDAQSNTIAMTVATYITVPMLSG